MTRNYSLWWPGLNIGVSTWRGLNIPYKSTQIIKTSSNFQHLEQHPNGIPGGQHPWRPTTSRLYTAKAHLMEKRTQSLDDPTTSLPLPLPFPFCHNPPPLPSSLHPIQITLLSLLTELLPFSSRQTSPSSLKSLKPNLQMPPSLHSF